MTFVNEQYSEQGLLVMLGSGLRGDLLVGYRSTEDEIHILPVSPGLVYQMAFFATGC